MRVGFQSAKAEISACITARRAQPEYAALLPHLMPLDNNGHPTAAQLADTAYPTAEEARLLAQYTSDTHCKNMFRAQAAALEPAALPAIEQLFVDKDAIDADLIGRKITWGEAAYRMNSVIAQDTPALRAADVATMSNLNAQHQQELAQRDRAVAAVGAVLGTAAAVTGAAADAYAAAHSPPTVVYTPVVVCRGWNC
jgi:hypothetical protein